MKRNQTMTSGSNEVALFPMEYLQVTQGRYSNPTHVGYNATDLAGKDRGIDQVFAPFTLKVRWKDPNTHTGVVLSNERHVLMANGKVQAPNTILMMLWHDNYIGDLHVGQVIPQGQKFYDEGTRGYATGNHVHLELSYGTYNGYPLYQLSNGYWTLKGTELNIEDCFHINDTKIVNNGGYKFKTFTQPKPSNNKPNFKGYKVGDLIEFSTMHKSHHEDPIVNNAPKNHLGRQVGYVIHLYPKDKYPLAVSKTKGGSQMGGVNPINVYRKNNNDILKGVNSPEQPKIKPKGQFKFKLDIDTRIRNGESGLAGKDTGLVYKDGMTVYYDKVYQKDGYTWISYISNSGVRRSVAVGKGNQIWGKNI